MLSILIWWAVPVTAGVFAAIVVVITRRVRAARADVQTLDRYERARRALSRTADRSRRE